MKSIDKIPADSVLHTWMKILSATEVPRTYQVATGLSTVGCAAGRQRFIDQLNWKVYPTLRILLVGPSGIGKDTSIDRAVECIQSIHSIPIIGGKTFESLAVELAQLPPPAVALVPAPEISAFIGKSSYQESMVQRITDLLSDKAQLDISTRKDGKLFITEPTVTMMAGSTVEWLQRAMPDGALEGGFFPRFLIVPEHYTGRFIPLVKRELSQKEIVTVRTARNEFTHWLREFHARLRKRKREIHLLHDAGDMYTTWYFNRHKFFAPSVRPYAERSRDQVLRIAMIVALTRNRDFIDTDDMQFGIEFVNELGGRIADVVLPPSYEGRCTLKIKELLPASTKAIVKALAPQFGRRVVIDAIQTLLITGEAYMDDKEVLCSGG